MNPSNPTPRRPRKPTLAAEVLEGREMMTGGVGSTFAIIPATIASPGGHTTVSFALDPKLFTDPGNKPFTIGIDIAPNSGSSANPTVTSVSTPTGKTLSVNHALFDPKVTRSGIQATSKVASAVTVVIPGLPAKSAKSFVYKVNVSGLAKTSGSVLVGFYLPGDANGTGKIDQANLNALNYAMGTNASDTTGKYSFDADANRNGAIDKLDLALAQKNFGVGTTVSPVISANLSPAGVTDPKNRVANVPNVTVTGAATPGSTIIYSKSGGTPITTTADASGKYSIPLTLAPGSNTFNVVSTDVFKQKISGTIAAITYNPSATTPMVAVVSSPSNPASVTTGTTTTPATTTPVATTTTTTTPVATTPATTTTTTTTTAA